MIDPGHGRFSIARQCALVSISRSSFYYQGKGESCGYQIIHPAGFGATRRAVT